MARNSNLVSLVGSAGLSNLADGVFQITLPLLALTITRDPAAFASVLLISRLPWLLFALPAGALADRLDRRRTMITVNISRAVTIGAFAGLAMLTKNSFLDQINQQYVVTARAKGLAERRVLYGHVFRNAMLIVIAGFPAAFIGVLFTGSLLIEVIFSLDGLGLLGFEAALNRDFPVLFGTLFFFSLLGLLLNLVGDLAYVVIDPRIDFESREV